jgi:hypothetical protein
MSQESVDAQQLLIKPFEVEDQEFVHKMIIDGLAEHWGEIDPTLNPDLKDIRSHYADATFLVARLGNRIIGSGALVRQSNQVAEIVRMSVVPDMRRKGLRRGYWKGFVGKPNVWGFSASFWKQPQHGMKQSNSTRNPAFGSHTTRRVHLVVRSTLLLILPQPDDGFCSEVVMAYPPLDDDAQSRSSRTHCDHCKVCAMLVPLPRWHTGERHHRS